MVKFQPLKGGSVFLCLRLLQKQSAEKQNKRQGRLSFSYHTVGATVRLPLTGGAGSPPPTDINLASGGSSTLDIFMGISETPLQTPTWPRAILGPPIYSWPSETAQTTNLSIASDGYTGHPYQHGFLRQQSLRTTPRPWKAAQTANVHTDLRLHSGLRSQHRPLTPT